MRIAVSGSIARDHLMTFPGRFAEQLVPESLATLSVSFLVDDLDVRPGGVAANICFGLAQLGERPLLVGAIGSDGTDYQEWLAEQGIDVSGVRVSESRHTARFTCTTDTDQNQIASFYPGAMSEARDIDLGGLGDFDLAVISPNDPEAMVRHTRWCAEHGVAFVADPSQQLASLDGEAVRTLVTGARLLFSNAYEAALLERKTGWDAAGVLDRVDIRVTTHGAEGAVVQRSGEPDLRVAVVPAQRVVDPTGVGDAFRAGFLAAQAWQLSLERSVQLGALLATLCVETPGPQEYRLDPGAASDRLSAAYGSAAAAEITSELQRRTRRP
jgi:adenosine kinase